MQGGVLYTEFNQNLCDKDVMLCWGVLVVDRLLYEITP